MTAASLVVDTKALPSTIPGRGPDGIDQLGTHKRFVKKSHCPSAGGTSARVVIAMSGQDHRRDIPARAPQVRQQTETVHSGHPQIQHETTRALGPTGLQERFRGVEDSDREADRRQQVTDGPSNGLVVVKDRDYTLAMFFHAATPSFAVKPQWRE
jgi:hypothetical protein